MQVWITGHHGFYVKLLDCLLMVLTRLTHTSVSGNKLPFSEMKLHKGQSVHVIWT